MSRILADLLAVDPKIFANTIYRLEHATGQTSADVRLTAEIVGKVQIKLKELGLDPHDTTGRELYAGLQNLTALHDSFLAKKIGGKKADDPAELLPKIRKAALKTESPKTAWVLRLRSAKQILKAHPPKKVMKYLGYKSLDSMLKREKIVELFLAAQLLESRTWLSGLFKHYKQLTHMDFESRKMDIVLLNEKKWGKMAHEYEERERHIIKAIRELGVIFVLPAPFQRRAGLTITVLPQLLHHLNETRLYSSYYKLHQLEPNLGEIVAGSLDSDSYMHVRLADQRMHWRVAQRHFGTPGRYSEILEPHVLAEDLLWRKVEEDLYRLEPALHFWYDLDYVMAEYDGRPLSLNLMDNAVNFFNKMPYDNRYAGYGREGLWNELYQRYMTHPVIENEVLRQLDRQPTPTEQLIRRIGIRRRK